MLIVLKCKSCQKITKRIVQDLKALEGYKCKFCSGELERVPQEITFSMKENIDNGLQIKRQENYVDLVDLRENLKSIKKT